MTNNKHEVLTTFRDKETGQLILSGSFFNTNDEKRLEDLIERGLVKSNEKASTVKKQEVKELKSKRVTSKKSGE